MNENYGVDIKNERRLWCRRLRGDMIEVFKMIYGIDKESSFVWMRIEEQEEMTFV